MEKIIYGLHESEFGEIIIARSDKGLCWLGFMVQGYKGDGLNRLRSFYPESECIRDDAQTLPLFKKTMQAWTSGQSRGLELDLRGRPLQRAVWNALLDIPRGQLRTYSDLAAAIGRPKAVRAVASAVGENPVSLLVPCHRIVRKDGGLGNYGWGIELKRALLDAECAAPLKNAA